MTEYPHIHAPEAEIIDPYEKDKTTLFGFWMYLMSDFILFAGLFATYAVYRSNVANGLSGSALFSMPYVLIETVVLLTSSFTCGMTLLAARKGSVRGVLGSLAVTGILGASFVALEFSEFANLIREGSGPQTSAFLSSYFTLVGTHGLHVTVGLLWIGALMVAIRIYGLTHANMRKLALFSVFWHFLDIIWIFIFTIVYLMRAL